MKKKLIILCALLVSILPYMIWAILQIDSPDGRDHGLAFLMISGCVSSVSGGILINCTEQSAVSGVKWSMIIKLIHIPNYVFLFMVGLVLWALPLGFIGSVLAFVADICMIASSGTFALFANVKAKREGLLTTGKMVLCIIVGYMFCIDVVVAIVEYILLRKKEKKIYVPEENTGV